MGRIVTLTLNDALYNAGLLGFLRICRKSNLPVQEVGNTINFDSDILKDFTSHYLQTLIDTFRDDIIYSEIMENYNRIVPLNMNQEENYKKFDESFKYIADKLKRASYLAGYEIIKARGDLYDFEVEVKTIKENKEYQEKRLLLDQLIDKIKKYKDVLIMKDITYTKIQPFWTNVAFLNSKRNKDEFDLCFTEAFTKPAYEFLPKEGKKVQLTCCQCDSAVTKSNGFTMSWINDVGVDTVRKTSYYWDFKVDSFLCPVCNLIYACIPLGFSMQGTEGIFVNDNESIDVLEEMNGVAVVKVDSRKEDIFYKVIDRFMDINQELTAQKEVNNIQVIRRSNGRYIFNILSKEKLNIIKYCKRDFAALVGISVKIQDDYLNVYRKVIQSILNGENLYPLIYILLHKGIDKSIRIWFLRYMIKIQAVAFSKGDEKMREKVVFAAMKRGEELRMRMLGDNQNENKVRTLSYKLLNALKVRNSNEFMDTVLRNYIGLGIQMPISFLDILKQEEKFLDFGYAFITGLNGGISKKEDEGEENAK
ncbi:type I-B CRISPR-associated protein Cas8b1/Cst1 [Pelosinus sp. sgz500959]|uniref:type I-B CRISPR-associated protein Cas8b1/Cst1 n=1 Tax=Pelosinus sp. sgz500959 TaxID=3242472 RepID=UPI00366C857E